jgi:hypothetical protein
LDLEIFQWATDRKSENEVVTASEVLADSGDIIIDAVESGIRKWLTRSFSFRFLGFLKREPQHMVDSMENHQGVVCRKAYNLRHQKSTFSFQEIVRNARRMGVPFVPL